MQKQQILKEAQKIASKYSFWMVSGDISHLYGYVYETPENKYELEIKFNDNFPNEPPEFIYHEKIKRLLGDIQLNSLNNWNINQSVVNLIDELYEKIQTKLNPQPITSENQEDEYITPDLGLYPAEMEIDEYITPSTSGVDLFYSGEDEKNQRLESTLELNNNENIPENIITSPKELFVDSDTTSLDINTELSLVQQEFAFDHQGDELANIIVYLTITLTKTFLIQINFSNYPNKPIINFPNEVKTILGDSNKSLDILKNWNKKNPSHIIDLIHEIEKKLYSVKKIETELNKISQEFQYEMLSGSICNIQVKLLTYGFKEYHVIIDLEPYPKLPIVELTSETRDIIWKPINELDSIKNWKENESESVEIIREISWLIDKNSRINFEIDLLKEHYKNIKYDILSNTINIDMKGKMKSEDLTFEFQIELPKEYPLTIPKISVLNEFELETHEKIKNDLNDSFKDFYNDWNPYHYLVDLFNLISKKIFEVSVVSCVICHKIECPTCTVRIAGSDGDACYMECPYCERPYHKHCWEQTISSFRKCGFCLKTPPPDFF